MCPFHNLYAKLHNLAFPARQTLLSNSREETPLLHRRRTALMSFLSILQDFFSQFSESLLESIYQDQKCAVMNAWMVFLNMDQYFQSAHGRSSDLKVHHPLRLTAWHRARQCESEKCSVGTDEGILCSAELQKKDDWIESLESSLATAASPKKVVGCSQITLGKSSSGALPTLNIRPLNVDTTETLLEDFRDHLLQVYGNHFAGLHISLLSERSRWELSLYIACCIGHIYAVRLILFYHCDSNVTLEDDTSCLHVAARLGHTGIVQLLIENGADVNCTNDAGTTPLIAACRHGKVETAKYLVELGADISMHSLRRTYPLHAAIVAGNCDIVSYLISKGANVNVSTINGITPLHFAVELGNPQVCRMLLRNSADVFHETIIEFVVERHIVRIDHTILQMSKAPKKDDVMIGAIRIVYNDSTKDVEEAITNSASNALRALCKGEKLQYTEVAEQVKKEMEQMQPGAWHVIVGKSFGSFVTHEVKCLLYFFLGQIGFLVYRHG
uniref:Uncharacterized protein AlNc14C2G364 n=1 Tax=Albugo laibachii Nc14 TaxID=890382 RepID=F0VZM6_9STRA|nr:conserved hypothetical protein [Albugo laibachii Nc14]|eukprot:CCA14256.1 conserved hypothetical protein [Albugo laibachii Nc14]